MNWHIKRYYILVKVEYVEGRAGETLSILYIRGGSGEEAEGTLRSPSKTQREARGGAGAVIRPERALVIVKHLFLGVGGGGRLGAWR